MLTDIDYSKPVQVYRNLNKPGCKFSVRQGGRVRGYVDSIILADCTFKHATPKQLAEVRTGARQVCQWITGTIVDVAPPIDPVRVSCDPKTADGFCVQGNRIDSAAAVHLSSSGCFASLT